MGLPTDPESDDIIMKSKFLSLLEHDGIAFRLEHKKQILRDIENAKKTAIPGKMEITILRNYKSVYEQEHQKKVKILFQNLKLKTNIKTDE